MDHDESGCAVTVPFHALSPAALVGVIDDYITREGTDYGDTDLDLLGKRAQVRRQLECGDVVITFDPQTRTTTLVPVHLRR
jgi:uncharacterized protein